MLVEHVRVLAARLHLNKLVTRMPRLTPRVHSCGVELVLCRSLLFAEEVTLRFLFGFFVLLGLLFRLMNRSDASEDFVEVLLVVYVVA